MYKYFIMMLLAELIASSSQIFLKMSSKKSYPSAIREYLNCLVIGGYSLLMVSMVITVVFGYNKLGYMGTVIMEPISYVFVLILSRIVFKEKISKRKIVGMSLIICGIAVFFLNKPM